MRTDTLRPDITDPAKYLVIGAVLHNKLRRRMLATVDDEEQLLLTQEIFEALCRLARQLHFRVRPIDGAKERFIEPAEAIQLFDKFPMFSMRAATAAHAIEVINDDQFVHLGRTAGEELERLKQIIKVNRDVIRIHPEGIIISTTRLKRVVAHLFPAV